MYALGATGIAVIVFVALCACASQPPSTGVPSPTALLKLPLPGTATPVTPATIGIVPTATPLPTLIVIPTITPFAPTPNNTPQGGNPGGQGAPSINKVFVTRIRIDPQTPHNKEPVAFFATFNNTAGQNVGTRWCAEVFRPDEDKSFGVTQCAAGVIPPGVSELRTFGWNIAGIRECIPLRARVVARGRGDARVPFKQPSGQNLWFSFQACP